MARSHTMRKLLFLCCLFSNFASGGDAPAGMTKFNVVCPAERLARQFDRAYHQCSVGYEDGSCETFVRLFRELLPEYDCQRDFDATPEKKYIVPAIWTLGSAEFEE